MFANASGKNAEQKILLYDSKVCRLCGDKNENGRPLFKCSESSEVCETSKLINQYLPVTVQDDGISPRWICPGCHIQLESTAQFFEMIHKGQQLIASLRLQEKQSREVQQNASKIARVDDLGPLYDTLDQAKWNELFGKPDLQTTDRDEMLVPLELFELEDLLKQGNNLPEQPPQQTPSRPDEQVQLQDGEPSNEGWEDGANDWVVKSEVTKVNGRLIGFVHNHNQTDIGSLVVMESGSGKKRTHAKFVCDICSKIFVQELCYLKHRKTHSILFECSACLLKFGSSIKLTIHQKVTQHNGKGIIEGLQISSTNVSKKHEGVSPGGDGGAKAQNDSMENGYACDNCEDTFPQLSNVLEHEESVHAGENRSFVCSECGKSFRAKNMLQRHQNTHTEDRPHQCTVCAAAFKTRSTLTKHARSHTDTKRYHCTMCTQQFAYKTSLDLHLNWHNGVKPFECEFCSKRFSQRGNLKEHLRVHSGDKPFSCSVCAARFTTSSQQRMHNRRHTNDRPHECEMCHKTFVLLEHFKIHMRRHRNEKPYACEQCTRSFAERWALRKHVRTHTHEKPYSCKQCAKPFADSSNLLRHVTTIHGKQAKTEGQFVTPTMAITDGAAPRLSAPVDSIDETAGLVALAENYSVLSLDATVFMDAQ